MPKCSFVLKSGKRCPKNGEGNPPTCDKHYEEMMDAAEVEDDDDEEDGEGYIEEMVDTVIEHPRVQGVFNRGASILDRFANIVDALAQGRRPSPPPTAEDIPPPPRQERRRRPPPHNEVREQTQKLAEAFMLFGWDAQKPFAETDVKKRKIELSRVYHPDATGGNADMMKRINAAADLLMNHVKNKTA